MDRLPKTDYWQPLIIFMQFKFEFYTMFTDQQDFKMTLNSTFLSLKSNL